MNPVATILLGGLALYVALGLANALAFVIFGVTRVQSAPVTIGATRPLPSQAPAPL